MAAAGHALVEAYAVLTLLPAPHRLSPADAWTLLSANFVERRVPALAARELVAVLARLATAGIAGGRTYDAVIGECAVRSGASVLLTFNPRHFEPPPAGVTIVVPAS
jgi:hypothetical protein